MTEIYAMRKVALKQWDNRSRSRKINYAGCSEGAKRSRRLLSEYDFHRFRYSKCFHLNDTIYYSTVELVLDNVYTVILYYSSVIDRANVFGCRGIPGLVVSSSQWPKLSCCFILMFSDWEDRAAYEIDQRRLGPGEQGQPVHLPKDNLIEKEALSLYKANGYNAYISDMISVNRSIKDIRHSQCKSMKYSAELPTVSVKINSFMCLLNSTKSLVCLAVICILFIQHNSTLIRSVYSIINRSPKKLLREVILVDDFSEKPFLKKPLEDFFKRVGLTNLVKAYRRKREGLIRARLCHLFNDSFRCVVEKFRVTTEFLIIWFFFLIILNFSHSMKGNQLFKYRFESEQIFHPVSSLLVFLQSSYFIM
uniref:Glyco_trans_2-like domain-containing protein n=1 Tax=Heterorhabditis bacteriophora TaxID=37862 RepID=A0A1I7WMF8_HETBA